MSIIAKAKALNLPLDTFVVIGSGLLDAYGLRQSNDIDIVVSKNDFDNLQQSREYTLEHRYGEDVLLKDDLEIWTGWGKGYDYEKIMSNAVTVQGVYFAHPETIIFFKQQRNSEKDQKDIILLREYIHEQ